jgi:GrpB-like predicted nucleotidyltransferase (UPF0157 family)
MPGSSPVEIIPYQPTWPAEFVEIALPLRRALGELALRIDHIGSTAVPGLAAKDVIDIQITVATLPASGTHRGDDALLAPMTSLGYVYKAEIFRDHAIPGFTGPDSEWEKWYFHQPAGCPPSGARSAHRTHIHVRVQGRANQRYALLFRDFLRAHPVTAEAYAELKRRLSKYLADPQDYPFVKDPAVDLIYLAAEEWASAVGWRPGPPDVWDGVLSPANLPGCATIKCRYVFFRPDFWP